MRNKEIEMSPEECAELTISSLQDEIKRMEIRKTELDIEIETRRKKISILKRAFLM